MPTSNVKWCLLYVACTRAREDLWIGWTGTPSRFLPLAAEPSLT